MNNSSNISTVCPNTDTFLYASEVAYRVTYNGIAFAYLILAPLGRLMALMVFWKQSQTQQAYVYQIVLAVNDIMLLFAELGYIFGFELCTGMDYHGGYEWYKKTYILMWYSAYVSVPLVDSLVTVSLLLSLSITIDRIFALVRPISYKAKNHKLHQATAVTICYIIGLSINIGNCVLFTLEQSEGTYNMAFNAKFVGTLAFDLTGYLHDAVISLGALALPICNTIMLYQFRKRNQKVGAITGVNAAKEADRRAHEKTLIILAASDSALNFISSGSLVVYYAALLFVPDFVDCYNMICTCFLDAALMIGDMFQFYIALALSKQLRKALAEALPCMSACKRCFARNQSAQAQQGVLIVATCPTHTSP